MLDERLDSFVTSYLTAQASLRSESSNRIEVDDSERRGGPVPFTTALTDLSYTVTVFRLYRLIRLRKWVYLLFSRDGGSSPKHLL